MCPVHSFLHVFGQKIGRLKGPFASWAEMIVEFLRRRRRCRYRRRRRRRCRRRRRRRGIIPIAGRFLGIFPHEVFEVFLRLVGQNLPRFGFVEKARRSRRRRRGGGRGDRRRLRMKN